VIPLFDSLQVATPEKGLTAKVPRNAPDSSTEGGVGTAFSDILDSHGTTLMTDADKAADPTTGTEGGNVLLSDGKALPPTPTVPAAPVMPVFDLLHGAESADIAATTAATADVPPDVLLPLGTQDSLTIGSGLLVAGEALSSTVAAVGQGVTELAGTELNLLGINGATVTAPAASAVDESDKGVEKILSALKGALVPAAPSMDDSDKAVEVILPAIQGATASVAPVVDNSASVGQAAEVVLPVTSELGDHAKKLIDRSGLSQASASAPNNTPEKVSNYQSNVVSPAEPLTVKPEQAMRVEPRAGDKLNMLAETASLAKADGRVERIEAQVGQSSNAQDFNQYRVLPGAQSTLLTEGLNRTAGQNFATAPSFASPVSQAGWGHEFVGRMNLMVKNGVQEMKLQLKPAEMGLLEIKLSTEGDQAKVIFNVHNAAARDAIDLAMPRLRDMLEQSGLQLAHSEVNDQSSQQNQGNAPDHLAALSSGSGVENDFTEGSPLDIAVRMADSQIDYYI